MIDGNARAREAPQELDPILAFGRRAVLHGEHRLLQRGRRVARDLTSDAEELAEVTLAVLQLLLDLRDARLVGHPLLVELLAALLGGVAARDCVLRRLLLLRELGAEPLESFLALAALVVTQALHVRHQTVQDRLLLRSRRLPVGLRLQLGSSRLRLRTRWRLLLLGERTASQRDRQHGDEADDGTPRSNRSHHDLPPWGAGTGTVIRSGATVCFAIRRASAIARLYSGASTQAFFC